MSFIEKARVQFRDSNLINSAREYLSSRDNRTKIVLFVLVAFVALGMFFRRLCCSGPNLNGSRVRTPGSTGIPGSIPTRRSNAEGANQTSSNSSNLNDASIIGSSVNPGQSTTVVRKPELSRVVQGSNGETQYDRLIPQAVFKASGEMEMRVTHFQEASELYCHARGVSPIFFVWGTDNANTVRMRSELNDRGEPINDQGGYQYRHDVSSFANIEDDPRVCQDGVGPLLTAEEVYNRYGRPTPTAASSILVPSIVSEDQFEPAMEAEGSNAQMSGLVGQNSTHSSTPSPKDIPQNVLNYGIREGAIFYQKGPGDVWYVVFPPKGDAPAWRVGFNRYGTDHNLFTDNPSDYAAPDAKGLLWPATVVQAMTDIPDSRGPTIISFNPGLPEQQHHDDPSSTNSQIGGIGGKPDREIQPLLEESPITSHTVTQVSTSSAPKEPQYDGFIPPAVVRVGKGIGAIGYQYGREGFVNVTFQHLVNPDLVIVREINLHGRVLALYDSPKDRYDEYCRGIGLHHVDARIVHEQYPDDVEEKGETVADPVDAPEGMIKLAQRYKPTYFQAAPSGQHYYLYMIGKDSTHVVYLHQDEDISDTANGCDLNIQPSMLRSTLNVPGYPLISYKAVQKHQGSEEDRKPQPQVSSDASNSVLYYLAASTPDYTKAGPRVFGGVMASLSSSSSNLQSAPLEFHTESTDVYVSSLTEVRDNILHGSDGADHGSSDQGSTSSSSSSSSSTSEPARRLITKEWIEQQKAIKISERKSIEGRLPKNYDEATEIIKEERASRALMGPQSQAWIDLRAKIDERKPQKLVKQASVSLLPTSSSSSSSDQGPGSI